MGILDKFLAVQLEVPVHLKGKRASRQEAVNKQKRLKESKNLSNAWHRMGVNFKPEFIRNRPGWVFDFLLEAPKSLHCNHGVSRQPKFEMNVDMLRKQPPECASTDRS